MIKMTDIKNFYKERGQKITTDKQNYSSRNYRIGDDDFPLSRSQLEKRYLSDSNNQRGD